jgi:hypothetical protein
MHNVHALCSFGFLGIKRLLQPFIVKLQIVYHTSSSMFTSAIFEFIILITIGLQNHAMHTQFINASKISENSLARYFLTKAWVKNTLVITLCKCYDLKQ